MELNSGISAIKFGAMWCAPCKLLESSLKKVASEFPRIQFLSVDIDDEPVKAKTYRIRSVPTVILLKDGQEVNRIVGAVKIDALRKTLKDILKDRAA